MRAPARHAPLEGLPVLEDLGDVTGRRVLVRTDFNVPLDQDETGAWRVVDDFRIRTALPTLRWLVERGAEVTVCSHLGRPHGQRDERWEMAPVRRRLDELLPGIDLLENLRFDPGEKANSERFVEHLVSGKDLYVNEAFGVSHRSHASLVGPPHLLPSAAGRRLVEEVGVIGSLLDEPARPFVAVVGGAKVSDKLGVLRALEQRVDILVVGGAMAYTFLLAQGHDVGASLVDCERLEECRQLLASCSTIILPTDTVALEPGGTIAPPGNGGPRGGAKVTGVDLADGWQGVDIGPESAATVAHAVQTAGTVLWNGPVGAFEDERFAGGTRAVAEAVAASPAYTVVGGGDTASAIDKFGLRSRIDFVSTGGGASLALMEHGDLPALVALRQAVNAPRPADS
jgi:phosphoglycerate kinase